MRLMNDESFSVKKHKIHKTSGYSGLIKSMGMPLLFKNLGLKLTKPREEILSTLYVAQKPLTIDDILLKLGNIDKVTLYRTLEFFTKHRLILRINLGKGTFFYEMNDAHHHHIVCRTCGDIEEFDLCELPNPMTISKKFSFINDHSLEYFGKCKKCV